MWPLWNLAVSELHSTFCDAILFSPALALHWCCMITDFPCVLCSWHPLKKNYFSTKLLHKHACFGFFQKPLVVQSLCLLTSPISNFTRQFQDTEMHVMLRGPDCSEEHERKRFLRTKDEKLSWALCLTEYGHSLYAKLEHYYKPLWRTEAALGTVKLYLPFFFFFFLI